MQVLGADLAILDEIDSGLDVDALRDVAEAVNRLLTPTNSLLMITHYARLLNSIKPTYIHVMVSHLKIFKNYVILSSV
jgi:Fe-S cluster assembly ATP-binding protein